MGLDRFCITNSIWFTTSIGTRLDLFSIQNLHLIKDLEFIVWDIKG